ncbi:Excinuclease ATPase subunit [Opitutaceae bacterium TAV1]|nr:Excinuclease ATPase subunit [Opitutaceae bacterium TAV1]
MATSASVKTSSSRSANARSAVARAPSSAPTPPAAAPEAIRLRGVRQNNLKNFDLDIPLGRYTVVTGVSGAGKSSLVFDTLHAEGQRRYVETFSAYTRQFLDLLDKPQVDSIENIRPSIAIEQTNTVKTSRSTVGTMTELTDFFKVWFSHTARCFDPETGEPVEDDTPHSIREKTWDAHAGDTLVIAFRINRPANLAWAEILQNLKTQGYTRVLLEDRKPEAGGPETGNKKPGKTAKPLPPPSPPVPRSADLPALPLQSARIDDLLDSPAPLPETLAHLHIAQDRIAITPENRSRFLEATETALHFGQNQVHLFAEKNRAWHEVGHYSRGLHSPKTGRTFRAATPALFSFNSPLGACPACRGFGRIIEIDYRLAIPDRTKTINDGAIKCWEGEVYGESKKDLLRFARKLKIPADIPFAELSPAQQAFIIDGEPDYGQPGREWPKAWYGLKGFFNWLDKNTYKTHVRVFLSRFRSYNLCPACQGTRLQPEALCWKWQGRTLPEIYQLPVRELLALLAVENGNPEKPVSGPGSSGLRPDAGEGAAPASLAFESILTRLRYLEQVGLGYLTLDRTSKTLSGGEVERVNLTSCLGTSLVDTLFVLDEPSVGLHPRDIDRLIAIIRTLTDAGNTVVVVEHDESMIRAADHVIEIGPEPGARGGHVVFEGPLANLLTSDALTGQYLSGRLRIDTPAVRRPCGAGVSPASKVARASRPHGLLTLTGATRHNLRDLTLRLPLHRLVALSGVSGSGKSTLLDNVIYQGLLARRHQLTEDPAAIASITGDDAIGEIVLVDQSPLSRTPRSNPALYTEAWELVRDLYAREPAAEAAGYTASSFSFNAGDGRCDHCNGLGFERVEMQFLSDVFVPCPVCEGRRFKPEILAVKHRGLSISDLLTTSIDDALVLFSGDDRAGGADVKTCEKIRTRLQPLADVGLGYLTLGQPLNTLSGGESQRLKLVRHLGGAADAAQSSVQGSESGVSAGNAPKPGTRQNAKPETLNARPSPARPAGALLLLDEPTTGLHRHDVKRLVTVLQRLVDAGHSVVVIEHNIDVLKSADWLIEVGPEAGADGGRIVAEGPPERIAQTDTATAPYLRAALADTAGSAFRVQGSELAASQSGTAKRTAGATPAKTLNAKPETPNRAGTVGALVLVGARENNLKNLSLSIPHRQLTVVTGVSGSGKSTLAFDIVFAEGQRRFMESMSPYARQFVEQLPRPAIDRLTGIPPTVAIEQRVTRGSRKSTVATITEVAQYLRLLYARLGIQHHPDTGRPVQPLTPAQLRKLLADVLASPAARRAGHLYLCAPLIRGRKGHHQPIATWIARQGYELMRADGRILRADTFKKLDRYKEHDIEAVVADLKSGKTNSGPGASAALDAALALGKGSCFLALPDTAKGSRILSWFSTTRTDIETGESFPELDPKHFSHNSPRGWCPVCRGHGRIYPWMLEADDDEDRNSNDPAAQLRALGIETADDLAEEGTPCPACHGDRLNRIARAVKLRFVRPKAEKPKPEKLKKNAAATAPVPAVGFQLSAFPDTLSLPELLRSTPAQLLAHLRRLDLDERGRLITQDIVPQIEERLRFLDHVGLGYLTLERPTATLSGGEAQRIRLAAQLGTNLAGVLYVLDEPSIGLHARDNDRLIETLETLRDKGNTLLVVEHDDELMDHADRIIDLGPAAGIHGGELLAEGTPAEIRQCDRSLTGLFLARGIRHPLRGAYRECGAGIPPAPWHGLPARDSAPQSRLQRAKNHPAASASPEPAGKMPVPPSAPSGFLTLTGARLRNLRDIDLRLPLGRLIMVAGPSGAGKSTLFRDLLHPAVAQAIKTDARKLTGRQFVRAGGITRDLPSSSSGATPASHATFPFDELRSANGFRSVIEVDQSPIGKTPRSTPATYLGIFDLIRQFFASLPEAKLRGYNAGRFSFNTAGGRCEACQGVGRIKLEMAFMPDTWLPCDDCHGLRYAPELSDITWKGKSIGEVLRLTFEEAVPFFDFHSQLSSVCRLMVDCGLGYLTLGQSSPTLSGGEAQRLKLVTELSRGLATYTERSRGTLPRNLYLLEEPTIGLHLSDCEKLINVLHALVDQGHTVVVIEHHLDLLAEADWIIELGPVGGPDGGHLLYQGPLAGLLDPANKNSPTAPYLRKKLVVKNEF